MDWFVLVLPGVVETTWAVALGKSNGLTALLPTAAFVICRVLSMLGLSYASKTIPMGTAYAVWTGIGAALTVVFGMATGSESASPVRIVLICGLVGCVIGLKLVSGAE